MVNILFLWNDEGWEQYLQLEHGGAGEQYNKSNSTYALNCLKSKCFKLREIKHIMLENKGLTITFHKNPCFKLEQIIYYIQGESSGDD